MMVHMDSMHVKSGWFKLKVCKQVWPKLAAFFELPLAEPQKFSMTTMMAYHVRCLSFNSATAFLDTDVLVELPYKILSAQ